MRALSEDPVIAQAIEAEERRQESTLDLIASENIASPAVRQAQGSVLTNKYAEGYPQHRYYQGCENIDTIEACAIERAKKLFSCAYANVQPHSGSAANAAVFMALLQPGDTLLGMELGAGGHLSHGASVSFSGKTYHAVGYGVDDKGWIDYGQVKALAEQHHPKLIIAGGSSYPRIIDFKKFKEVAASVGAYLVVDMAHFAGLVAGGVYPSPAPYADVITSTTHKTLRGPRGGLILTNNPQLARLIDSAVFPGLQGGPLPQVVAAKAVAFQEALSPDFARYAQQVVANAKAMADTLLQRGFSLTTQGTDTHVILVDLRAQNLTGKQAAEALEQAGLVCNKNSVPADTQPPSITSGIRLGTPSLTTRGFKEDDCRVVARIVADVLDTLQTQPDHIATMIKVAQDKVRELTLQFPINTKGGL
ncbi:MAG: serine hydroxymethyltransferase [Alphaproteobacteria bacterium]|nr:serine hydroxymethyltransferase [Alphaproteobacteria bacterium]